MTTEIMTIEDYRTLPASAKTELDQWLEDAGVPVGETFCIIRHEDDDPDAPWRYQVQRTIRREDGDGVEVCGGERPDCVCDLDTEPHIALRLEDLDVDRPAPAWQAGLFADAV